ncbi:MAG: type III secretion apparatus [Shewanella sp.]|nr:type III secretion apparatus [Shewanella sp.]
MDLQSSRNLQELFQLLNRWPVSLEEQMEYHWAPYGLMLEIKNQRLLMTSWLLETQVQDLNLWLTRWHPQAFLGVPQRLFLIKQKMMISCLCPSNSEGRNWYQMVLLQQQFLNKVDHGGLV